MDISILGIGILLACILAAVTLHEAMHAFVSHWLGDDTAFLEGRLTLNPIAHIDIVTTVLLPLTLAIIGLPPFGAAKPVPTNPYKLKGGDWGMALVAVAGPLTNLALAIVAGLLWRVIGFDSGLFGDILKAFLSVNLAFFIFNMIPFPPLDGSRVLYAIAPDGIRSLMRAIEQTGFAAILIFMFLIFPMLRPLFLEVFNTLGSLIVGNFTL